MEFFTQNNYDFLCESFKNWVFENFSTNPKKDDYKDIYNIMVKASNNNKKPKNISNKKFNDLLNKKVFEISVKKYSQKVKKEIDDIRQEDILRQITPSIQQNEPDNISKTYDLMSKERDYQTESMKPNNPFVNTSNEIEKMTSVNPKVLQGTMSLENDDNKNINELFSNLQKEREYSNINSDNPNKNSNVNSDNVAKKEQEQEDVLETFESSKHENSLDDYFTNTDIDKLKEWAQKKGIEPNLEFQNTKPNRTEDDIKEDEQLSERPLVENIVMPEKKDMPVNLVPPNGVDFMLMTEALNNMKNEPKLITHVLSIDSDHRRIDDGVYPNVYPTDNCFDYNVYNPKINSVSSYFSIDMKPIDNRTNKWTSPDDEEKNITNAGMGYILNAPDLNNTVSVEVLSVLIPNVGEKDAHLERCGTDFEKINTPTGKEFFNEPYLFLQIPELKTQLYSTLPDGQSVFCKLIRDDTDDKWVVMAVEGTPRIYLKPGFKIEKLTFRLIKSNGELYDFRNAGLRPHFNQYFCPDVLGYSVNCNTCIEESNRIYDCVGGKEEAPKENDQNCCGYDNVTITLQIKCLENYMENPVIH